MGSTVIKKNNARYVATPCTRVSSSDSVLVYAVMSSGGQQPTTKRPRLEDDNGLGNEEEEQPKMKTVLCLCGAMSPITFMHLRMLGQWWLYIHEGSD